MDRYKNTSTFANSNENYEELLENKKVASINQYSKYDFIYYLKKNIILGIFVIMTELLFLFVISKNYIYIDKKYVLSETMKKIKY